SDCPKLKNQNRRNKTGNKTNKARGKAYVLGGGEANPDSNLVTGTFLLNNHSAYMLFDSGADMSFVSTTFSALLDVIPATLDVSYTVELAHGRISETNTVHRNFKPKRDIGFSSLHNVSIDQLPSKLGWFVVSKFENYMLSLDTGDKIEVTRQKIHDMLGVPVGGYSLFDLDEREADHEFVKLWVGQFHPLELRDLRVNDIARKLVAAKEIDFLFKVNFLTLFTNTMGKADGLKGQICLDVVKRLREDSVISDIDWCGYIYDCLRDSKLPSGTNHYLGPLTFLILLYLDSTKFDRFLVVRTRPAIRNWSTYLMRQRQELELKEHVVGLLDLNSDWTETKVKEAEGFIGSVENFEKEILFLFDVWYYDYSIDGVMGMMMMGQEMMVDVRGDGAMGDVMKYMMLVNGYDTDGVKKLFASYLRLYGHERDSKDCGRLKAWQSLA
ncbi:hypothetical protein Tco_0911652, partial [Tanacetum coccineum]